MIRCLARDFKVHVISTGRGPVPDAICEPLPIPPRTNFSRVAKLTRLALRCHEAQIWNPALRDLAARHHALDHAIITVHDLVLLPIALAMRRSGRVLFDAREYYPLHFENFWWWRALYAPFNQYLCRRYLHQADHLVTVSQGLADAYLKNFGIHSQLLPSMPEAADLQPGPVNSGLVRMIYHGSAAPNRRIELTIDLMRLLPPHFTLDLMLVGQDSAYENSLRRRARDLANVTFRKPVPFAEIIKETNRYDIGIFLCPPSTFNLRHALPNKFFEFIQARLMIAIGPSPAMAAYVREHDLGVVAEDFTPGTLAKALGALTPADIARFKHNAHLAASRLHAGQSNQIMYSIIKNEAGTNPSATPL
jgi:hypothetical protein